MIKILLLLMPFVLLAMQKVSVQLEWKHQFEFAGFYAAIENGYYKDAGLDVTLKEYRDNLDISRDILAQKSDFGISSSSLILDKLKGEDVVLLSSYFKQNVLALATQKNIKNIKDLKNKKIMALPYEMKHTSLGVMLEQNGIKNGDYTLVNHDFMIDKFVSGEVDAMSIFTTNQPYMLDKKGVDYNILNPARYGIFSYDLELFSSRKFINRHKKLVENFINATNRGWKYAFAHKREIVNLIYDKYSKRKSKEALLYEAVKTEKLFKTNLFSIGAVVPELIILNAQIYNKTKNIDKAEIVSLIKSYTLNKTNENRYASSIELTKKERAYLKNTKIKMCIDPDWMPLERFLGKKYIGMSADYFKIIEKNLGINIELVPTKTWEESLRLAQKRECDILSLAMKTAKREKYLNFTSPYLSTPLVVATSIDAPFIADFHSLTKEQKLGIPKGYAYAEILKDRYPNLNIVSVENLQDGLEKVRQGELFGYVGSLATIGYEFQKNYIGELKIAGKFDDKWELGIAVRNDDKTLFNILQKGALSITENENKEILNRWIAINYEKSVNYKFLFKIITFASLIIFLIMYWNRKLSKFNRELQVAKERADEMREDKANFLTNVSHEIRTPMNSIVGNLYLMRETNLSERQKKYIKKIENSTNDLLKLINDILDFSKLEVKKSRLSNENFNLLEVLDNISNQFNQEIYMKSLKFSINYDPDMQMYLYGDRFKLTHILTNLISNAVKFTQKGAIELLVEQTDEDLFRFSITDTGIGIQQSQIEKIFSSFTQVDSKTTREFSGTGLGLAISKELVELMGGKIWVNSTYGKGSKFTFEVKLSIQKDLTSTNKNIQNSKKNRDKDELERLFEELRKAIEHNRPQPCKEIMQEIENHELPLEKKKLFDRVKPLVRKYKFAQAKELFL